MTKGYSLGQDLRLLVNNPKYSDIEILCGDEKILYGCRAILAARSEVFERLLYNGMKESYEKQISFSKINSSEMKIVLEYIYTGSITEESLTKDNLVEAFYLADYFELPDLQNFITKAVKNNLEEDYYSPELLSKIADTTPLSQDNALLNILVKDVASIPLNDIEFGRLSIAALQYLLSCTHEKEMPSFATSEYEVFRYSAILAAKQVSDDVYKSLIKQLPTSEQIKNSTSTKNNSITEHQKVAKELEPLVKFIDFRRIKEKILTDIIETLEIIPTEIILNAQQYKTSSSNNSELDEFRGMRQSYYVWDESLCESGLIFEDNGKVVQASGRQSQSVRAKMMFENKGFFEWDIIIEKFSANIHVGVCTSENINSGWFLYSSGILWNYKKWIFNYCPKFERRAKITIHLDMNKKSLVFTVDDVKYQEVSMFDGNLPSKKLHPIVTLSEPGRIRIQPHYI